MAKKIGIAIAVIIIVGSVYTFSARGKLMRLSVAADKDWVNIEAQYKDRLASLSEFMNTTKGTMAQEKKYFEDFDSSKAKLKDGANVDEKVKAINKLEGDVQKVIVALDKYPDLKNSPDIQNFAVKVQDNQNIDEAKKQFNDTVALYNFTIHRIRYRFISAFFGINPRNDLKSIKELNKNAAANAAKAAEKNLNQN